MSDASNAPQVSKDEQNWAMGCHLAALSGFVIPFGNIVGPLVVWLIKRGEMPMVDQHGKESLNFQITATIAALICIPLIPLFCIGGLLGLAVQIVRIIFSIIGTIESNKGNAYRYPLTFRMIK